MDDQLLVKMLNKTNLEDDNTSDSLNFSFVKPQGPVLENVNDGILNVDTDKLYNEYCANSFSENSLTKYENLYNDFKIVLKIAESLKTEYKNVDSPSHGFKASKKESPSSPKTTNLIDF